MGAVLCLSYLGAFAHISEFRVCPLCKLVLAKQQSLGDVLLNRTLTNAQQARYLLLTEAIYLSQDENLTATGRECLYGAAQDPELLLQLIVRV